MTSSPIDAGQVLFAGAVDLASHDDLLAIGLAAIGRAANRCLLVDLSRVTFIDANGLDVFVKLRDAATEALEPGPVLGRIGGRHFHTLEDTRRFIVAHQRDAAPPTLQA